MTYSLQVEGEKEVRSWCNFKGEGTTYSLEVGREGKRSGL